MFRSEKRSGKPLCLALMLVNLRRNFLCTGACSSAKMKAVMLQSDVPYLVRDCKARTPSFRFHVCVHGICSGVRALANVKQHVIRIEECLVVWHFRVRD